jgi:hypothetical protein
VGHIRESKLDNGMVGLEITYGGKESPFGGVDTSAPPMYIEGNCFVQAGGFLAIDEQLTAVGWFDSGVQLQTWSVFDVLLGSGSWFVGGKYKNFVLSCAQHVLVNPSGFSLTYKIWTWNAGVTGVIPIASTLTINQGPEFADAVPAVSQLSVSNSYTVTVPVTITLTVNAIPVNVVYNPTGGGVPNTPKLLAAALVSAINAVGGYPCTAALNSDGLTITLTTVATGSAANATTISVTYNPTTQPKNGVNVFSDFSGGVDAYTIPSGQYGNPLSWTAVGETLYFSGTSATMILSYTEISGTPEFLILTQYLGATTLSKFNGQLIAVGIALGPGLRLSSPEMILAWSAPNALGVWNPVNADGTVTGAGFNQDTDISDYLTGVLISRGAAILLKSQGIDYITPLSNGTIPFDFAHISNALQGEGAQDTRLVTQYDQLGVFVGNSDVYEFTGGLNPIGDKIRNLLIGSLGSNISNRGAAAGPFGNQAGDIHVLIFFLIDFMIFVYNGSNKTWMLIPLAQLGGQANLFGLTFWKAFASIANQPQFNTYALPVLSVQDNVANAPSFLYLQQDVQNSSFTHGQASFVLFPQEEIMFGRDITIDGLYINVAGVPGQVLNFTVTGNNTQAEGGGAAPSLTGSLVLPAYAVAGTFFNYQVFFNTSANDKGTMQNPQLRLDVPLSAAGVVQPLSIGKIAMFTSFDPNQRPV